MVPEIIECYSPCGVNVRRIINRVLRFIDPALLNGLKAIVLVDKHPSGRGFGLYTDATIYIFAEEVIGWQPWIFRRTYVFPYLTIGLTLGHELDHHVNRNIFPKDPELHAELNAMKYVYPSLGIFKPLLKAISLIARILKKESNVNGTRSNRQ